MLPHPPDSVSRIHRQNLWLKSGVGHVHRVILRTFTDDETVTEIPRQRLFSVTSYVKQTFRQTQHQLIKKLFILLISIHTQIAAELQNRQKQKYIYATKK